MIEENKSNFSDIITLARIVLWVLIIVGTVLMLKYFGNLLKPLVIALILWYLIGILKGLIRKIKIGNFVLPGWLCTIISFLTILFIIYLVVNIIVVNLQQIVSRIDEYDNRQDSLLNQLISFLGLEELSVNIKDLPGSKELRPFLTNLINSLSIVVGNTFIILIYLIFILIEELVFKKKIHKIYKRNEYYREMWMIVNRMNESIKRYLSVKSFASILTAFLAYWILFFIGVDYPLLWSFIIFIFNYIPYVGSFIATLLPSLFAAIQFQSLISFVWVFLAVQAAQTLVASFIEPKIVGSSMNLSPLVVLITLAIWGSIWGILGMIIAVPVTSIIVIILAQFPKTQKIAIFLSASGNIDSLVIPENNKSYKKE